jgi:hypothetical protein
MADLSQVTEFIQAIRADKAVGRGSCSSIDECWDEKQLIENLVRANITTAEAAVTWAREVEQQFLDRASDCRWGEDDDPELAILREFKKLCEDNPVGLSQANQTKGQTNG